MWSIHAVDLLNTIGVDAVWYFLLKEGSLHQDKGMDILYILEFLCFSENLQNEIEQCDSVQYNYCIESRTMQLMSVIML